MKDYGTIPMTSSPAPASGYMCRAKQRWNEQRRSWKETFDYNSISFPHNLNDAIGRFKTNTAYFLNNYAEIVYLIVCLSLVLHPISFTMFMFLVPAWIILYFLRDEPLVVMNRSIEDWFVLLILGTLTILFLFLTDAIGNILISFSIGLVLVLIHAVVRNSDNLSVDQVADDESAPFLARTPPPGSSA